MRYQLNCVRAFVTDFGSEALIVDTEDILPRFLEILLGITPKIETVKFLFPRAIVVPGIHHILDNVLKAWPGRLIGQRPFLA